MNKKFLLLILLAIAGILAGFAIGFFQKHESGDPLEKILPEEKIKGYMNGTRILLASNLSSKTISGGDVLLAEAITPGPVEPGRLRPTCLGVLKGLLQQNPKADWICVFLAEDSSLAATSNWVAVAEYHHGQITLRGGFPSARQLDSLQSLGIPAHRPDAVEAAMVNEVFTANQGLKSDRWNLSQTLRGASNASLNREGFFKLELDTRTLADVGAKHGMSGDQVRSLVLGVTRYYWLMMGETLEPQ